MSRKRKWVIFVLFMIILFVGGWSVYWLAGGFESADDEFDRITGGEMVAADSVAAADEDYIYRYYERKFDLVDAARRIDVDNRFTMKGMYWLMDCESLDSDAKGHFFPRQKVALDKNDQPWVYFMGTMRREVTADPRLSSYWMKRVSRGDFTGKTAYEWIEEAAMTQEYPDVTFEIYKHFCRYFGDDGGSTERRLMQLRAYTENALARNYFRIMGQIADRQVGSFSFLVKGQVIFSYYDIFYGPKDQPQDTYFVLAVEDTLVLLCYGTKPSREERMFLTKRDFEIQPYNRFLVVIKK